MSHEFSLTASGTGLEVANTAEPSSFEIQAPGVKDGQLEVVVVGPKGPVKSTLKATGAGAFSVTYQAEVEGKHEVQFTLKTSHSVGVVVGTDASKCKAYGPGLEDGVEDTLPTTFTIEARGTDGQPMGKGGDPFEVKVTGPQGDVPAKITDNGDGTYTVDYDPENAGDHVVAVTLKGKPVDQSPYNVSVSEGASHKNSGIGDWSFVIQARTKSGKDMVKGGQNFTVEVTGPSGPVECKVQDHANGKYGVSYKYDAEAPGQYKVDARTNKYPVKGSPFTHTF